VLPSGGPPFSWIDPVPIWRSRNQYLSRIFGDPTNDERRRWMEIQHQTGRLQEGLILDQHADLEEVSFVVVGDTGEGDASQHAVVKPLLARGGDTDFMVVCSDVIYPSGDAEDHDAKFYDPYEDYAHPIEGGGTVDEVVRAPEHNYVAAVRGDIHNYQRYSVRVSGRQTPLHYIVSGGGGAYMSATHRIPKVELDGVVEDDFVCYPRRGDSLSRYSGLYDRRFGFGRGWLELAPDEAAAYMAERLGIQPTRPGDRAAYVSERVRRVAGWIFPLPGRGRGPLHHFFSEFFDWNEPPLFKNFLRIDASASEVRIRCFAATGCAEHEDRPPLEDEVRIPLR
jgi:hypothetical protein